MVGVAIRENSLRLLAEQIATLPNIKGVAEGWQSTRGVADRSFDS